MAIPRLPDKDDLPHIKYEIGDDASNIVVTGEWTGDPPAPLPNSPAPYNCLGYAMYLGTDENLQWYDPDKLSDTRDYLTKAGYLECDAPGAEDATVDVWGKSEYQVAHVTVKYPGPFTGLLAQYANTDLWESKMTAGPRATHQREISGNPDIDNYHLLASFKLAGKKK